MKIAILAILAAFALLFGCAGSPINEGYTAEGRAYRGAASPKLVIYEYSDFECPFCGKVQPAVEETLRAYPDTVQLQYRHYPLLDVHPNSLGAAVAAVCAEKQEKFWKMHDLMFSNQQALQAADLRKYASEAGMDLGEYDSCVSSDGAAQKVREDMLVANSAGVQATPTFVVGSSQVRGAQPFSKFKTAIDSELARLG